MPAGNVEILREGFARLEREGTPNFEMLDSEIEIINFDSFPLTRPYYGWDGALAWLVDMSEPFDEFSYELVDVLAHDANQVVTTLRVSAKSHSGGPPLDLVWGAVWTFRDGKVVRVRGFRTAGEALESAGLAE